VLLDITHLDPKVIMQRLPGIREISIQFAGTDPIKEPIPVVPTCHYQMGGIPDQLQRPGGGAARQQHERCRAGFLRRRRVRLRLGARRQPSRHQLAARPAGVRQVGRRDRRRGRPKSVRAHKPLPQEAIDRTLARINRLDTQKDGADVHEARLAMQRTMQNHCGVFRFADKLKEGVSKILEVQKDVRAHRRSRTSRRSSTPPASRRWNWTT
jgi:succinate dehydrogenase / fumarate reductase flavoprotein subunit